MSNNNNPIDMERLFGAFANNFEKCTTRAEFDAEMRRFLSNVHRIALSDHWSLQNGSGRAGDSVSRIIAVFQKFREPEPGNENMQGQQTSKQEASNAIIAWAKQSYDAISSDDSEMADMRRAGLLSDMRIDLINIEPLDDMWRARLAIAGGRFDIIVTFWLEGNHMHIEDTQEAPGTDVSQLERDPNE
jgi:hypothetical protein